MTWFPERQLSVRYLSPPLAMLRIFSAASIVLIPAISFDIQAAGIDFVQDIQPLIESACLHCHKGDDADGELRLDSLDAALTGGVSGPAVVPSKPDRSPLYLTTVLNADHEDIMPPDGPPLTKGQTDRIRQWIVEGANWPKDVELTEKPRVDFQEQVQPILEENCVSCHRPEHAEGDYNLATNVAAEELADGTPALVAFRPQASPLYTLTILDKEASELMPPVESGGPLTRESIDILRLWISQGAIWPDDISLRPREKKRFPMESPDNSELVKRIHERIVEQSGEISSASMRDYSQEIPKTGIVYHMTAIPGGKFVMGSPDDQNSREPCEGPQTEVTVSPFWMGTYEVTWDEYELFMITQVERQKNGARTDYDPAVHTVVDAVSRPTAPYMEMSFGMGQSGYPAISMTQHAANKYCQWLSAQTGHFYRLPTEAEWEYACRSGTTTAYYFGDDPGQLDEYAWYYDNSNEKYQKVGQKKPNPWGLYDMHGNVSEWTTDQFVEDYFTRIRAETTDPIVAPETLYPRSVRGGSWFDDPEHLRSSYRFGSKPEWKQQDPQLPKSIWYHTDARWLGFRIVRPLKVPTPRQMEFYWNSATGKR